MERILLEREKVLLEQSVEIGCSYCKKINDMVPVKLGQRNTFRCRHCNQENLVTFFFGSAQITKPIEIPHLGAIPQREV